MSFSSAAFLKDTFDPQSLINDLFLSKLDLQSLSSLNFSSLNTSFLQFQEELQKAKLRFTEELETCLLVNEINAETRQTEQKIILQEYDELDKMALELEYALTRSDDGTIHLENSLRFFETEKLNDLFTKELLEIFIELNKGEESRFDAFGFEKQALYLYILNKVVTTISQNAEFERAIEIVKGKYEGFKGKLLGEFKEAYWKYDTTALKALSNLLEKYGLLQEMSIFFIETSLHDVKTFKSIIDPKDFDNNCRFFLESLQGILRAFQRLFEQKNDDFMKSQTAEFQIQEIFADRTTEIVKQIFSYTFENFLRKGLELFLEPNKSDKDLYLRYLEFLMLNIRYFSSEVLSIESPIRGQIRDLLSSYSNALYDEIRSGYYELETSNFQDFLDDKVAKVLLMFKNAEHSKKNMKSPEKMNSQGKKKPFSWNSLIFHDQTTSKETNKKVSKQERLRKLALLKDSSLCEIIEECFRRLNEASRRCQLISQEINKTLNIYGLLEVFLNHFGLGLLEPLINYTEELIPGLNSKKFLDESFFEIVSRLNVFIQRLDLAYLNCSKNLNLINESQDFLNKKESLVQRLTILLHKTIQNSLASIFIYSNRILSEKQKKKDFMGECGTLRTEACGEFIKHMKKYVSVIKDFAFDKTRINILSSLGTQIISMLSEHLTHFKVNIKGSSTLINDLMEYISFLNDFGDENLKKETEGFLVVAKVFTIPNEKVGEYCKEKSIEHKELLQKFLKNRG